VTRLGDTDLDVFPLCLGGNVFGWTADRDESFAVLDAYADAGGNFIDTADAYSAWVAGNIGGESETIIGEWMAARRNRDRTIVATKVGHERGLSRRNVVEGCEASLRRLGTDTIDLYFVHFDDPDTPLEEALETFHGLVREGKVRYIAASNYTAPRLAEALAVCDRLGLARFVALEPHYNLVEREEFEGELQALCLHEGLACLPYYSLAKGFLTGKHRPGAEQADSRRTGRRGSPYLTESRNVALLDILDEVAAAHETTVAAVALAWLLAQPTVTSVIASARTPEQLAGLLPMVDLTLHDPEVERLSAATARAVAAR
jgi:aryl-alcohol dehydrogenase-like predicted oxidoreductase